MKLVVTVSTKVHDGRRLGLFRFGAFAHQA